jgi:hypothetical protein
VWVADRGFASAANRAYLTRGGGHYIHAEKLCVTNTEAAAALARAGRYRTVADNLRVKEVAVASGGDGDGGNVNPIWPHCDGAPAPSGTKSGWHSHGVAEGAGPVGDVDVGGQDRRAFQVALVDDLEQRGCAVAGQGR